jgi:endonuclease/exonuclease/phosphatase family metal-dependent hydrolase
MKNKILNAVLAGAALLACGTAFAGSKADIVVMTQNQYLGADLVPIIAAPPAQRNAAIIAALETVSGNNYPERVQALAESIHDKQPHLVALQEMYRFTCFDPLDPLGEGRCAQFPNAFNDYVDATIAELDGAYEVAAVVENLALPPAVLGLPGIPVYLPAVPTVPIFVQVLDRDVILARTDVTTSVVDFACDRNSVDGCNYFYVAPFSLFGLDLFIERGFVAVDATVNGEEYRFVNTHLEIERPDGTPQSIFFQTMQAVELLQVLSANATSRRLIIAGDFNSSPTDISMIGLPTAYQILAGAYTDVWYLRPGKPPGFTCCELGDLSNAPSLHDERIDLVFGLPAPTTVKANVLDAEVDDKTLSGLWPSDHASVSAELSY